MNNSTDFITSILPPSTKCDFTNLDMMRVVLKNLIDIRCAYLTENGVEFANDLELVNLEDFYNMLSREMHNQRNNNKK